MPANVGIYIEGRQVVQPGVFARTNVEAFNLQRPPLAKRLAIVAPAMGGVPQAMTRLQGSSVARRALKGGRALEMAELAIDPSRQLVGAGDIVVYRVNAAVQASLDLGDLVVRARPEHAGLFGNGFRVSRSGSPGEIVVSVSDVSTGEGETSSALGYALGLAYSGGGTPSASVAEQDGVKTLTLSGEAFEQTVILLGDGGARTIADLAELINASSYFSAEVLGDHALYSARLLPVGETTFDAGRARIDMGVFAQVAFLQDSALVEGSAQEGVPTFINAGQQSLAGGSEGPAATIDDYRKALEALEGEDVQVVIVGSDNPVVQVMAATHCEQMSHPVARLERAFFGGPPLLGNERAQTEAAINLAKELGSERATIVGTPSKRRNLRTGLIQDLSPNMVAAQLAGMFAGARPEISLTYKTIISSGLTYPLSQQSINDMLKNGVVPIIQDAEDGVYRIAQGITAWQLDTNVMRRKIVGVSIRDYLTRKLRLYTKPFVGAVGDATTVESILNRVVTALNEEVRGGQNPDGVLTTGTGEDGVFEPAFKNVIAQFEGTDMVAVEFEAHPVGEIAYLLHTAYLTPTRIVARA